MIKAILIIAILTISIMAGNSSDTILIATGNISSCSYSQCNYRKNTDMSIAFNTKELSSAEKKFKLTRIKDEYFCDHILGDSPLQCTQSDKNWIVYVNPENGSCIKMSKLFSNNYLFMIIDYTAFNVYIYYGKINWLKDDPYTK